MCFSGLGEERASLLRETEALAPPLAPAVQQCAVTTLEQKSGIAVISDRVVSDVRVDEALEKEKEKGCPGRGASAR